MKARYIPNIISLIRILLVGVFAYVFLGYYPEGIIPAAIIFIFSGVTDVIDGALARHFCWTSRLGIILDPIADKLMQCTVLLCLVIKSSVVPWWIFAFYIIKEGMMAAGAILLFKRRKEVYASKVFGKISTVLFYTVIAAIILWGDVFGPVVCAILCAVVAVVAVTALVLYAYSYMRKESSEKGTEVSEDGAIN